MGRSLWLCGVLCAVPSAFAGPAQDNVLILIADDLGVDWLGMYGLAADPPSTPHLDALAASGIRFQNAWSTPLCSPTRAAIQTGRYGFRTGVGNLVDATYALPLAELTLPEVLDLGTGGATAHALFGKWHLGNSAVGGELAPNLAGWGHFAGTAVAVGVAGPGENYFEYTKVVDGKVEVVDGYLTSDLVDDALAWIAAADGAGEPWLAVTAFQAVHTPFHAPPPELHGVDLSGAGPPESDPVPYYRAMVESLDTELGRLLEGVDLERTTVVFVADNGTSYEVVVPPFDPARAKNTVYEGGVRVPLFVAGSAVLAPGTTCDALVSAVDLFATAVELAGVDLSAVLPPEHVLDSVSLVPYLADPALPSLRSTVFTELFLPNGPVAGPWPEAVIGTFCQADEGFGGPGSVALAMCGDPLIAIGSADLRVSGAPPFAPSILALAALAQPTPLLGGTLVPYPPALLLPLVADAAGEVVLPGLHGPLPGLLELYVQVAVLDPGQSQGLAFTNALRVAFLPWNAKAMRDARYKLIADVHGGFVRFYDLLLDPLEHDDLLVQGPLSPEAEESYLALRAELDALLAPP
jgi:arylsulfatase A-like enzyme